MAQRDSLSITDNRTGKSYEVQITDGTIKALDLRQIKTSAEDFGMMTYDPGFTNTASCRSSVTFIDGDLGILRHGGYPIEELAERASFLEVSYLLYNGELPNRSQLETFGVLMGLFALYQWWRHDGHGTAAFAFTACLFVAMAAWARRRQIRADRRARED